MKRVVMAVLMFGIASCADRAPAPPADQTSQLEAPEAQPQANSCGFFACVPRAQCRADEGGIVRGTCNGGSWVCCDL